MKLQRSIHQPIRNVTNWDDRWSGEDEGFITCWERGREMRDEYPSVAERAMRGQLVVLPWKGGVDRAIKKKHKYGSFNYLAMWQGLRNQDLDLDTSKEVSLVCSITGVEVVFTGNMNYFLANDGM